MNVTIVEESTTKLLFEVKGVSHTLANALKFELRNDSGVKAAGYAIGHPLVGTPRFVVETKKGTSPKKAVSEAVKRLQKTYAEIGKKAKVLK